MLFDRPVILLYLLFIYSLQSAKESSSISLLDDSGIIGFSGDYVDTISSTFLISPWKRFRHLENISSKKKRFLSSRLCYTSNSVATYQILRLAVSDDIEINPGPNQSVNELCSSQNILSSPSTSYAAGLSSYGPRCTLLNSRSLYNKFLEFQGLIYGNNLDVLQ